MGNPVNVRIGPGKLYWAPIGTPVPSDLATAWDTDWVQLGYTHEGSTFSIAADFQDVTVAEEYEPIAILQVSRTITIKFQLAELTAENLLRAMNGGTTTTVDGVTTYTPPAAGEFTPAMLGWESDDGLERWVFRRVIQTGNIEIPRKKAPEKAVIPVEFRAMKPAGSAAFVWIHDADYAA
jgi:hypothetical protein